MSLVENGSDYDILRKSAASIVGVPGVTVEIGLRQGGGTKAIIDGLLSANDHNRTHIAIDPYGHLPYAVKENEIVEYDYTNDMRNKTLRNLYDYISGKPIDFQFYNMEDTEFFARFSDGIPTYNNKEKRLINQYALVYFDGPHTLADTMRETLFFAPRAPSKAIFVYDDVEGFYNHNAIREYHYTNGWINFLEGKTKIAYLKA